MKLRKVKVKSLPAANKNPILKNSDYVLPFDPYEPDENVFFYWANERHKIYLSRKNGAKRPWTEDPILANYRFCNVYRQLDTVSVWIYKNLLVPNKDNPHLWFIAAIARLVNHVETLDELNKTPGCIPQKGKWSPTAFFKVLSRRKNAKLQFVTGAYIINSVWHESMDIRAKGCKAGYITYVPLNELWKDQPSSDDFKGTKQHAIETLREYRGFGPFIANQVCTDLEYLSGWLKNAPDINTYVTPGPGTKKGVRYLLENQPSGPAIPESIIMEKLIELLQLQESKSDKNQFWEINSKKFDKGNAFIQLSNMSNCSCEVSKLLKVYRGEGDMRSRYNGVKESEDQLPLF